MSNNYHEVMKNFCEFLMDAGVKIIRFYQFDFLILYFPLYMVINDLKSALRRVRIDFEIIESDEKILKKLEDDKIESFNVQGLELNFGLCEPVLFNKLKEETNRVEDKSELKILRDKYKKHLEHPFSQWECISYMTPQTSQYAYFIHLPFINFPPLYAVALKNNPIINSIKRKESMEGNGKVFITDFWKHFSAKLSLLKKDDFERLSASSYPKGSTADWFIRVKVNNDNYNFQKITWIKSIEKEFDDLFHQLVDVAFTIQPWNAILKSETEELPIDIDIVYKSLSKDYHSTSIIFHTLRKEHLAIGDYILNCFNILLKAKINILYDSEAKDLKNLIQSYCQLRRDNNHPNNELCKKCSHRRGKRFVNKDGCLFEKYMALRLTNDSQVYKQLPNIADDIIKETVVANYFFEKFKDSPNEILQYLT